MSRSATLVAKQTLKLVQSIPEQGRVVGHGRFMLRCIDRRDAAFHPVPYIVLQSEALNPSALYEQLAKPSLGSKPSRLYGVLFETRGHESLQFSRKKSKGMVEAYQRREAREIQGMGLDCEAKALPA